MFVINANNTSETGSRPCGSLPDSSLLRRGHTILYVEDEDSDRELFAFAMRSTGAESGLQLVSDSMEAKAYLEGRNGYEDRDRFPFPSLILIDSRTSLINGDEFLVWLKNSPFQDLPVIVFSGSASREELNRMLRLGAWMTIPKEVDFGHLKTVVSFLGGLKLEK